MLECYICTRYHYDILILYKLFLYYSNHIQSKWVIDMHVHIATIGQNTDAVLNGLKLIPGIEKVYLLYSSKYKESAMVVENYLQKGNTPCILEPVDEYDFQSTMNVIYEVVEEERKKGKPSFTLNVTGGTKLMAFAAYSSAYLIGATVYYVQERTDVPYDERLMTLLTTQAPTGELQNKKWIEILRFIYNGTMNNGTVTNTDIKNRFEMSSNQVSYYVRVFRQKGLITTSNGVEDNNKETVNYRYNSIKLTQQGMMIAKFS